MKALEALKMRWVVWVWNHTPTCAEMARLTSQSLDRPPSPKARVRMWLHHLICVWCDRYRKQLTFLRRAAPRYPQELEAASPRTLSAEAKQRMVQRLHAAHDR